MSLFNFFKRKKEEQTSKKHDFESLPVLIEEEIKNIHGTSEKFKNELKEMTESFSKDAKENISKLKSLNLDKRKDESQALKDIVMANLHSYIFLLEKLTENLEKIESEDIEGYINKIRSSFNSFNKSSRIIYERATILIGKELAEVRNSIDNFAKEFNTKLETNKKDLERANLVKTLQNNLDKLKETKSIQEQIDRLIADIENKKSEVEKEKQLVKENYEAYRNSAEFRVFAESQENLRRENKILDEDTLKLKQEINLKDLAKYFHNDLKKDKIIRRYSEDFFDSLKNDSNLEIILLLKEANQSVDEERIKSLRQRILGKKDPAEDAKIKELSGRLITLDQELNYEEDNIKKEQDKILKFKEKQDQISAKIAEIAGKVWDDFRA